MYVVRNTFIAKPGNATKLAKLFCRVFAGKGNYRVLTDFVSEFNTVVLESTHASLAEYEQTMEEYARGELGLSPELAEEMKAYTSLWKTGRREVLKVMEA
ncbi:hypothetical protein KDL44_09110 [bacterium]|nr:hypothetical protein [bacterium]